MKRLSNEILNAYVDLINYRRIKCLPSDQSSVNFVLFRPEMLSKLIDLHMEGMYDKKTINQILREQNFDGTVISEQSFFIFTFP